MSAITTVVNELQNHAIPALQNAGCQFIPTRSDKSVLSYDTLSAAEARDHLRSGGSLAWRSPELSVVDVDHPRHAELVYELGWRGVPFQYTPSQTSGRGHVIVKAALDDYDWNCAYGFGEIRHWRYTQAYQFDSLARAIRLKHVDSVERTMLELLPATVPTLVVGYPGTELRLKSFVCKLLNTSYDWALWATENDVEYNQARAQWTTGQKFADRKLSKAKARALPLSMMPRSSKMTATYTLMCAVAADDECWLSQQQVGNALGIHQTSAGRIFGRLTALGYITAIGTMPNRGQGSDVVKWRLLQ